MKKAGLMVLVLCMVAMLAACGSGNKQDAKEANNGGDQDRIVTSIGEGDGKHGTIKVEVTFENDEITDIKVLEQKENEVLAEPVYKELRETMIASNSAEGGCDQRLDGHKPGLHRRGEGCGSEGRLDACGEAGGRQKPDRRAGRADV